MNNREKVSELYREQSIVACGVQGKYWDDPDWQKIDKELIRLTCGLATGELKAEDDYHETERG